MNHSHQRNTDADENCLVPHVVPGLNSLSDNFFRKQVSRSKLEAEKENIKVPTTVDEYCVKSRPSRSETEDVTDFYDDDYADDLDDDDEEEDCMEYSEDSGNEET